MNDRAVDLLEQYDIEVLRTRKGRGAIVCDAKEGSFVLKEYTGSSEHAKLQNRLLETINAAGKVSVEQIVPTKAGELLAKDVDETAYILKSWQDGRECIVHDSGECVQVVKLLATLHQSMEITPEGLEIPESYSPEEEYEKHNREIKRVKKYLKQKGQKQLFERSLLNACDIFLEQAQEVTRDWEKYKGIFTLDKEDTDEKIRFCHGDYQYHNVILGKNGWFVINFERCVPDRPIRDLYLLMRKLLEKGNWSVSLGTDLLRAYEGEHPLSARDRIDLYYRLSYPEKFWKIANFYYNSGKSWIPGKNSEKLETVIAQEKEKQHFLDEVFRDVSNMRSS